MRVEPCLLFTLFQGMHLGHGVLQGIAVLGMDQFASSGSGTLLLDLRSATRHFPLTNSFCATHAHKQFPKGSLQAKLTLEKSKTR